MKKLTRKLFISVLVAVFAFVALGTSTYAWITINTTAEVQEFEATVDAGTAGIELCEVEALNPNWSAVLELKEDFTTTGKALNDLTSADGKTFYDMVSNGSQMSLKAEQVTDEKGYIEFQIKIRRTNVAADDTGETKVKIDGSKVKFIQNAEAGANEYTYVDANGVAKESDALYATNALRMSLTWEKEGKTVIYQQKEDTTGAPADGNTLGYAAGGFAHVYAADQGITVDTSQYAEPTKVYQCGEDVLEFITLTGATEETITVRLWIEGWDNECHSKILSQSFSVAFGFGI